MNGLVCLAGAASIKPGDDSHEAAGSELGEILLG